MNNEILYEESLKHQNLYGLKGFLLVILLVFGALSIVLLVGFIEYLTGLYFLRFILLGIILVVCYFIVKFFLTNYSYIITGDEVIILQSVGKRERVIRNFSFDQIKFKGLYCDAKGFLFNKKCERATYLSLNDKTGCIVCSDFYVLLNVSSDFFAFLDNIMS